MLIFKRISNKIFILIFLPNNNALSNPTTSNDSLMLGTSFGQHVNKTSSNHSWQDILIEMVEHHSPTVSLASKFIELVAENNKRFVVEGVKQIKNNIFLWNNQDLLSDLSTMSFSCFRWSKQNKKIARKCPEDRSILKINYYTHICLFGVEETVEKKISWVVGKSFFDYI